MVHRLLFVDDEENVLKGIKRLFIGTEYEVMIESDCSKALDIVKDKKISVLVSDMRMPEMSGVKLIQLANEVDPLCIKIILSGYSDIDDIMTAINEGHIYGYITKPWHEASLKLVIANACGLYESKIKEKLLLKKLREKQEELLELNRSLEEKIAERTMEIKETNTILNRIIKGDSEEEILLQVAKNLSLIAGKTVSAVFSSGEGRFYCSSPEKEKIFAPLKGKLEKSGTEIDAEKYYSIPIKKDEKILGAAVFIKKEGVDFRALAGRFDSFLSSARLYLSQKQLVDNSSEFVGSIDSIIGEMGDE